MTPPWGHAVERGGHAFQGEHWAMLACTLNVPDAQLWQARFTDAVPARETYVPGAHVAQSVQQVAGLAS
jgi:hypothetical protein